MTKRRTDFGNEGYKQCGIRIPYNLYLNIMMHAERLCVTFNALVVEALMLTSLDHNVMQQIEGRLGIEQGTGEESGMGKAAGDSR